MHKIPINYMSEPAYNIIIDDGFLFENMELDSFSGRKAMVITDEKTAPYFLMPLRAKISRYFSEIGFLELAPSEEAKTLESVSYIYDKLLEHHFDRSDVLIALGGGVVGDVTGFCAATYMRGIRYIQVPTTLLAQTDAAIGGKTGVNFNGHKNIVGAFHMPSGVYIHPQTLNHLPDRQLASGMAENIKHALIRDESFAGYLVSVRDRVFNRDFETLSRIIMTSCEIKKAVVEKDPEERGERAVLNFGHTIGHAIEKALDFKLLHGECVALGSVAAAYLSVKRNLISTDKLEFVKKLFYIYNLPISCAVELDSEYIVDLIRSDKKRDGDRIRFVLLNKIGEAVIDDSIRDDEMIEAVQYLSV